MKRQVIFLDIDGTLQGFGRAVPDSARLAIRLAREQGHLIFIATGRSLSDIPEGIRNLGIDGILCAEGNHLEINGVPIYHHPIPLPDLTDCVNYLKEKKIYYTLQSNRGTFITPTSARREAALRERESEEYLKLLQSFPSYHLVEDDRLEDINKVWIFDSVYSAEELRKVFADRFRVMETKIAKMGSNSCEMTPCGNTKATGIRRIIEALKIEREDTFAFGDDTNDLEMLAFAGHGIAMGNAREEVKLAADDVTASVDEDGIYLAFKKYGLIK